MFRPLFYIFMIPPVLALVTSLEYRARYPVFTFGSKPFHSALRFSHSSSGTCTSKIRFSMSTMTWSPFSTNASGPPSAASGDTCPIERPRDAPEKRPSVISATLGQAPFRQSETSEQASPACPGRPLALHNG